MHRKFFFFSFIVAVLVLTTLFLKDIEQAIKAVSHYDKHAHFAAFFGLSFIAEKAFRWPTWIKITLLIAYGGLIEIAQSNLTHRSGSWLDWLADIGGILTFFAIWELIKWKKRGQSSAKDQ